MPKKGESVSSDSVSMTYKADTTKQKCVRTTVTLFPHTETGERKKKKKKDVSLFQFSNVGIVSGLFVWDLRSSWTGDFSETYEPWSRV